MSEFPRVQLPDVSEDERQEVQRLIAKEAHEREVWQRNREGMVRALIAKGVTALPTHTKKRKKR